LVKDFELHTKPHRGPEYKYINEDLNFMASVNNPSASTIDVWSVTGVPGTSQPVAVATTSLAISTLTTPPNAAQGGTSKLVDTNDNALDFP
jgi:hypothetical protein